MERKWSMRAYKEGDEKGILELRKAVYPERKYDEEQWLRWWRWMYKDNPAGIGRIWLAEHNGQIVGHSAIILIMMKIGTEVVTGFQSIDTMTHPEYRGQGIYQTIAKLVYDEAAKENIHIGYRLPSNLAHPIAIKKLDWFDIATTQLLFKSLHWENAIRIRISNRLLSRFLAIGGNMVERVIYTAERAPNVEGLALRQISRFDERINDFYTRISSQYQIMVVRNEEYLNWRYVAVPNVDYVIYLAEKAREVCGYFVLRCEDRDQAKVGIIFDILAQSEEIAHCLISKAIEHCKQERADLINSHIIANEAFLKAFKKNGFISTPFVKGTRFCGYSSSTDVPKEFLKDPKNWLYLIGDSDTL